MPEPNVTDENATDLAALNTTDPAEMNSTNSSSSQNSSNETANASNETARHSYDPRFLAISNHTPIFKLRATNESVENLCPTWRERRCNTLSLHTEIAAWRALLKLLMHQEQFLKRLRKHWTETEKTGVEKMLEGYWLKAENMFNQWFTPWEREKIDYNWAYRNLELLMRSEQFLVSR